MSYRIDIFVCEMFLDAIGLVMQGHLACKTFCISSSLWMQSYLQ